MPFLREILVEIHITDDKGIQPDVQADKRFDIQTKETKEQTKHGTSVNTKKNWRMETKKQEGKK